MKARLTSASLLSIALLLSACAVGPDYQRPGAPVPADFKEAGGWKVSEPKPVDDNPEWWAAFGDPVLDRLEREVTVSSQNVAAAEAAYRAAAAAADSADAALFPAIGIDGNFTRERTEGFNPLTRQGLGSIGNAVSAGVSTNWALDIWGKLRRSLESAEASAEASRDDLAAARLTAQAALAGDYFSLRGADELQRLLDATVIAYERSLEITRNQYRAGTAAKSDVEQATTQLESTRSQAIAVGVTRGTLEHAIAVLLGKAPAEFSLPPQPGLAAAPMVPVSVPSSLLERRPDIAAAERQMAAANAQIGVAIAAYFPDLTFSASTNNQATMFNKLLSAANNAWSFGPSLAETVIDWGARDAQVAQARATFDQQVATYRQTVLTAFQQVEDDLVSLSRLSREAEVEDRAVASAVEAERLITNQYKAGTVSYTSVITAQTAALAARQSALSIHQNRLTTTVALLQAMGGGWKVDTAAR